jgi:hypothetical protein
METKTCNTCNINKPVMEFSPTSSYQGKKYYRGECKSCNRDIQKKPNRKASQKKYRASEKYKETRKEYRHQPEVREKERIYDNTKRLSYRKARFEVRYNSDPLFNLKHRLRCRLYDMLRKRKWHKANSFVKYIGCTLSELHTHIENQFIVGMTWEKVMNGEIEIDHIIPLSSAKDSESMMKLCHYTNLQPLWKLDNRQKSDKMPD